MVDNTLDEIKRAAQGHWQEILVNAGIDRSHLLQVNRPCPLCGGHDRFSFDLNNLDGRWFCRGCGYGDGIELVKRFRGMSFPETLKYLCRVLGLNERRFSEVKPQRNRARAFAAQVWKRSQPLADADSENPVGLYLQSRGLEIDEFENSPALRYCPALDYWDCRGNSPASEQWRHEQWPALVAALTDPRGQFVTVHRTYLDPSGKKAAVPCPKKLCKGKIRGGLIRLFEPDDILGIAEGIETALSAAALFHMPVWSAVTAGGMKNVYSLPRSIKKVVVFGDNDKTFVGQAAAWQLAADLKRRSPHIQVDVKIPAQPGTDWNDVLRRERSV